MSRVESLKLFGDISKVSDKYKSWHLKDDENEIKDNRKLKTLLNYHNSRFDHIKEKYDAAIIDLPYGLFTPTTLKEQTDIINYSRNITNKLVLITFEDMDEYIKSAGFNIIESSFVCKGKFKRFVRVCI